MQSDSFRRIWNPSNGTFDVALYIITGSQSLTISSNLRGGQRPGRHACVEHGPRVANPARRSCGLLCFRVEMSRAKGCARGARQGCCIMIADPVFVAAKMLRGGQAPGQRCNPSMVSVARTEHFCGCESLGPNVS